jgi:hypothetical protein
MISEGVVFSSVAGTTFEEVFVFILAFAQAGESRLASSICMLEGTREDGFSQE